MSHALTTYTVSLPLCATCGQKTRNQKYVIIIFLHILKHVFAKNNGQRKSCNRKTTEDSMPYKIMQESGITSQKIKHTEPNDKTVSCNQKKGIEDRTFNHYMMYTYMYIYSYIYIYTPGWPGWWFEPL